MKTFFNIARNIFAIIGLFFTTAFFSVLCTGKYYISRKPSLYP